MKLFGTDGIRGSHGKFPMDNLTIKKIGLAVSRVLHKNINTIYVAHDGRESHKSVYENLLEGLLFEKVYTVKYLGLLPTPALPYLISSDKKQDSIGIQITASHNPYFDNGLKNGEWATFTEEGKLFSIGFYLNDYKDGAWKYFYKSGYEVFLSTFTD